MDLSSITQNPRTKKISIVVAVALVIAMIAIAVAVTRDDPNDAQASGTSSESSEGVITPGTPANGAPSGGGTPAAGQPSNGGEQPGNGGASTVAQTEAKAGNVGEPQAVAPRSPVRCDSGGDPKTGSTPSEDARNGKKWVTVKKLSGGCDKSSDQFSLRGIDTRLVWQSDASDFNAFIVDQADPDAAAGYSDASCSGPCAEYQFLTNKSGRYNMRVQADGGPWLVLIQEYR